jgi:hypothetical protein
VDREAITRDRRRQQVLEAMEFERGREEALADELADRVTEVEGPRVDEAAFASMDPAEVELIRVLFDARAWDEDDEEEAFTLDEPAEDDQATAEEEIARLTGELDQCRRTIRAYEHYLTVLDAPATEGSGLDRHQLEAAWLAAEPSPRGSGSVRVICVRPAEGVHECPGRVRVTPEGGVEGDRWVNGKRPDPEAQITLTNVRVIELISGNGTPLDAAGDNFVVDLDLAEDALPARTRLRLGGALLEVSAAPHTGCKKFRQRFGLEALMWVNDNRERRLRGVNCRVVESGEVAVGDAIEVVEAPA